MFRRFLLLLSAVLALVPASGAALCVEASGHLAIELAGTDCSPTAAESETCMDACRDCEDTPLSVGAAQQVTKHVEFDAAAIPTTLPFGIACREDVRAPRREGGLTARYENRSPLLRC